jgi:hypothetical protein
VEKVIHVITEDARDGMGIKFGFSFSVEIAALRNDSRVMTWRPEHMVTGGKAVLYGVVGYAIHDEQGMVESIWPEITW